MTKRSGLGRGLDSLIPITQEPSVEPSERQGGVISIPVTAISRNPRQPRQRFDPAELAEMATSIREHGVIQPLIVKRAEQTGQYTLIAGERRLLAARQAALVSKGAHLAPGPQGRAPHQETPPPGQEGPRLRRCDSGLISVQC